MSLGATPETHPVATNQVQPVAQPVASTSADSAVEAEPALIALSDKAAEKIIEIRGEENIEDTYALRLKVQGGGCSGFSYDLYFDQPQDIDRTF
ncbi:MAG: hypothetical protein ABUS79_08955, partial [Pseudomonadota bacterium]